SFYGVHSASNVPSFPTGVLSNSNILGFRYALPLPGTGNYSQTMSMGFDHKAVAQALVLGGPDGPTTPTPSIDYVPLVLGYNGAWLEDGGSTALDNTLTLGVRGLFGNRDADFAAKRTDASAQYTVLRSGLRQTNTYERWTFNERLEFQIASGPLVPNEQ